MKTLIPILILTAQIAVAGPILKTENSADYEAGNKVGLRVGEEYFSKGKPNPESWAEIQPIALAYQRRLAPRSNEEWVSGFCHAFGHAFEREEDKARKQFQAENEARMKSATSTVTANARRVGFGTQFEPLPINHFITLPTAPDSPRLNEFLLPVYFGYPPRDYQIIGRLYVQAEGDDGDRSGAEFRSRAIRSAVNAARLHRADAVMIEKTPLGMTPRLVVMACAIKWK